MATYLPEHHLSPCTIAEWEEAWQMAWVADTLPGIATAEEFVLGLPTLDDRRKGNLIFFLELRKRTLS